jgi:uncharacterized protein YkwD
MAGFCKHNYQYTQGHFYCTKCGRTTYGRSHKKRQTKKIGIGIVGITVVGIIGFLFVSGVFEVNQKNLEESIQNMPESIQDTAKTAKDFATETSTTLRKAINEQLESVQTETENISVDTVSDIPKKIQESNPLNKKPIIDKNELEKQVHLLTNQYRVQNGLETLSWDDKLSNIARNHSQDMASRDYFSHDTPEGTDPTGRGTSHGYNCEKRVGNLIYSGIAENIFQNNLYDRIWYTGGIPTTYEWNTLDEIAQSTVDGWMNSAGHRQNILTETYDREGIGVEIASDDKVYITQNFC